MIKGIISNGVVIPRDPLPDDWKEGTEVAVERFPADAVAVRDSACTDAWMVIWKPSPVRRPEG